MATYLHRKPTPPILERILQGLARAPPGSLRCASVTGRACEEDKTAARKPSAWFDVSPPHRAVAGFHRSRKYRGRGSKAGFQDRGSRAGIRERVGAEQRLDDPRHCHGETHTEFSRQTHPSHSHHSHLRRPIRRRWHTGDQQETRGRWVSRHHSVGLSVFSGHSAIPWALSPFLREV